MFSCPDDKILNLPTGRLGKLGRGDSGKRLQRLKAPKVLRPIRAQLEGCCYSLDFEDASEKSFEGLGEWSGVLKFLRMNHG